MEITSSTAHAILAAVATSCFEGYIKRPKDLNFDINEATKDLVQKIKALYPGIYNQYDKWIKDQL